MAAKSKHKIKSIAGTLLFHAGILALLILLGFSTSLPLPGEEGVEISLGNGNEGFGQIQPLKPVAVEKTQTPPPPVKHKEVNEEIATQNIEEAPAIETSEVKPTEKEIKVVEEVIKEPEIIEPVVNPAALYKGKSKDTKEQGSEGIIGNEGDQGKPTGSIDSKKYLGSGGFGDGPSYSLGGREHRKLAKPKANFSENATVVVQIYVNRAGKVVKAVAIDKGSTTTSTNLRKMAEQAALGSIFQAKPDAAEVQRGTITYHFVVKNQ
ncbi:MAG: hypothetical protein K9G76_10785 [Bacteroidales bacterium]|nr:hypothetical protein [Bacteroidales bacterium]MCF8404255.1 hypothetical protein [Bacteroidales bacterium]